MLGETTRGPSGWNRRQMTLAALAVLVTLGTLAAIAFPSIRRACERSTQLGRVRALRERLGDGFRSSERPSGRLRGLLDLDGMAPELASWASVGGCGVGGGAGGAIRWMGRRTGTQPELEAISSLSAGEDLTTYSVSLQATADVPGRLNLGVIVPLKRNIRKVDYQDDSLEVDWGIGDVSLLVSRPFGIEGDVTANLTITLPSGDYKRYDGILTTTTRYYPYDAQLGTGVATVGLQVERSLDQDWGPVILGGGYTHNGGENEIGDLRGDTLAAFCYVGYRTEMMVLSLGVNASYALAKDKEQGTEALDQDLLLISVQTGVEFSFQRLPLFLAVVTTLGESSGLVSTTFALGLVTSF